MSTIPIEELRALKARLDKGEISSDEFQREKRRLLGLGSTKDSVPQSQTPDAVPIKPAEPKRQPVETEQQKMEKELKEANAQILAQNNNSFYYRDAVRIGKYDYNKWIMEYSNNRFSFSKPKLNRTDQLLTPNYVPVTTEYKLLADRIMDDFDHYGVEEFSVRQVLYWHCTTIDMLSVMKRHRMVDLLISTFLDDDWTFTSAVNNQRLWKQYFGDPTRRKGEIQKWLNNCTGMQLCGVFCLCKAYGSINLAYALAKVVEEKKESQWKSSFDEIYQMVGQKTFRISLAQSIVFENFAFYYNFHFKENGPSTK